MRLFLNAKYLKPSVFIEIQCRPKGSALISKDFFSLPDTSTGHYWMTFVGPIHPGRIIFSENQFPFLSSGIFNWVIFSNEKSGASNAIEIAQNNNCAWEQWEIENQNIKKFNYLIPDERKKDIDNTLLSLIDGLQPNMIAAMREYCVLIASAIGRAQLFSPTSASDLIMFNDKFRVLIEELAQQPRDWPTLQAQLVITNAVVSRYSSQAFSGAIPIFETECQFWTHSLLGAGTAALALENIRRGIESTIVSSEYVERIDALKSRPPHNINLLELTSRDSFWDKEHIFQECESDKDSLEQKYSEALEGKQNDTMPLLTCYSGRDGFKSTDLSLSAPLEIISSCNSASWTLLTLTHEITHTLVRGILSLFFPAPNDDEAISKALNVMHKEFVPRNLFEQIQIHIYHDLCRLSCLSTIDLNTETFKRLIQIQYPEINEIYTHILDFLYFYNQEPQKYITSVWMSWSAVPNIQHRLTDYITRSLCALHSLNLKRENSLDITIEQLKHLLNALHKSHPQEKYIKDAVTLLDTETEAFRKHLMNRSGMVKIARYFLHSDWLQEKIHAEPRAGGGGANGGYKISSLKFEPQSIGNPLRFIASFGGDKKPDHKKSLWMIQQLAFMEDN